MTSKCAGSRFRSFICLSALVWTGLSSGGALARSAHRAVVDPDSDACVSSVADVQRHAQSPDGLLNAIATIESGRPDRATRQAVPWPWTIDVYGMGYFYQTKAQAIGAVQALQAAGVRSIDVGCMQMNLMYHPDAFKSLDEAFDPRTNVVQGARFLTALYHQSGSWPKAVAAYHSQTADIGASYEKRVVALWSPGSAVTAAPVKVAEVSDPARANETAAYAGMRQQAQEDQARLLSMYGPATPPADRAADGVPIPLRHRSRHVVPAPAAVVVAARQPDWQAQLSQVHWLDGATRR